jgi:glycosyltransferase involved in cell wall biosynthesis
MDAWTESIMTDPRKPVSFIVPAYNCARTIRDAVASIFEDNFEPRDEVVIVDDCSTDNTPRVLEELRRHREGIRVLRHSHNKGTAAAGRNTGIESASNDVLFCLDADNILAAGSIRPLFQAMTAARAQAAAFGEIHFFRKSVGKVTHKWIFRQEISLADALSGIVWPGPSGNYLFTRASWERAGRYYEPFLENRSLDSWAFGIRQLATGSKMVTLPQSWYFHRYGHESHYMQNWRRGNPSMAGLVGLIPFMDLIEELDVEYILSREGRTRWYEHLRERPLRLKSGTRGVDGSIEYLPLYDKEQRRLRATALIRKVRSRLRGR